MNRVRVFIMIFLALICVIVYLSSQKTDVNKLEPNPQQGGARGSSEAKKRFPTPLLVRTQREMPANRFWVSETSTPKHEITKWFFWDGYEQSGQLFSDGDTLNLKNETLDVSRFILSESLTKAIEQSKELKWLKIKIDSPEAIEWLRKLTKLEGLYLDASKLTTVEIESLSSLVNLKFLVINGTPSGEMPGLPSLEFLQAELKDPQVPKAGQFPKLSGLRFGWKSEVTDEGIRQLANACPQLKYLGLRKLKFLGIDCLEPLFRFSELEFLDIGEMGLESWAGLLQEKLPNCFISFGS